MRTEAVYRALLRCYPAAFRQEYGGEMQFVFAEQIGEARRTGSLGRESKLWIRAATDAATVGPKEHAHVLLQDTKYALRTMKASPGFALVAIVSLAIGIGANTAIFSVWNTVLAAILPVPQPDRLVMLTTPDGSGVMVGMEAGERSLMTFAEFEQLRDRAEGFSSLMAAESQLSRLPLRMEGEPDMEARGRLVSGGYFGTLGVKPLLGRFFTAEDDRRDAPFAVLSYDFWQRALAGRPDAIGRAISIRNAALTVIGIAPPGFTGETLDQRPDLWIAMRNQTGVIPGRNRLVDVGPDKVCWLRVFGRLKPGVSIERAQAAANAVFQAGLKDYYGAILPPETVRELLDQRLVVRPAANGASDSRKRLADPIRILLAAAGVVLLIACCNLANLLLARGAARQHEMSLRLSLGASRGRLVRQLLTESMALALVGGAAGIGLAYALNRGLARLLVQSDETLHIGFGIDARLLLFGIAITVGSALVFGVLPALLATRGCAQDAFRGQNRTSSASSGQLRWGRALVALQLALSLPALAAAGLLIRTLANLQNLELGYDRQHLAAARVNIEVTGLEMPRREPLMRKVFDEIKLIPGVQAASYSENGFFSGHDSGDDIEVEGYAGTGKGSSSRWDQVGPGYFAALGVPMMLGRDIAEADNAAAPKVCVINEAFAKKFFAGRNPLGMRITTVLSDKRLVHRVVGVARDFRSDHRLRRAVQPRYFAPLAQPLGEFDSAAFVVRTGGDPSPVLEALRRTIRRVEPTLDIDHLDAMETRVNRVVARDRLLAILTACFGAVAILLSAVGLYGVLAYGVTRRRVEIGIRVALGAEPGRVIRMIVREAAGTLAAGLAIGGALAYSGVGLVTSQVYGVAPADPATLVCVVAVLVAVALTAAYLPARRAARLEPMLALRQE